MRKAPPSRQAPRSNRKLRALTCTPKVGDVVAGKYRIEKIVGEGGMGIVYAAHHLVLDQRVALKLLLVDSMGEEETVERFVREARAAARLRSEHVVRVTDAGALDSGLPFLVMEYLQGCDLDELVELEGPLAPADVADYMLQVLMALAQAHAAGIVHRDLKPANLFLALREDGTNILKVLDFGISKQRSEQAQWKELTGNSVLGTPAYISPEQLRSSKNVDARADLWSLGVVMYELLTTKLPFDGESQGAMFAAILEQAPAPLDVHRPGLPPAWQDVVARCLQRVPEARFADVGELARALAPLASARWAHAVPAIEQALSLSPRGLPKGNVVLEENAVAAATTWLPPPMRAPLPTDAGVAFEWSQQRTGRDPALGMDKTLLADVLGAFSASRGGAGRVGPLGRLRSRFALVSASAASTCLIAVIALATRLSPAAAAHAASASNAATSTATPADETASLRAGGPPAVGSADMGAKEPDKAKAPTPSIPVVHPPPPTVAAHARHGQRFKSLQSLR